MNESFRTKSETAAVDGLILAAGASSRMGRDKAAIEVRGRSFLEHCVAGVAPHCRQVAIVLGYHADAIEAMLRPRIQLQPDAGDLLWARNPAPERGQFSSLQAGLQALGGNGQALIVCPVDHPLFQTATVAALISAWREDMAATIVKPAWRGRHGHPVLYGPEAVEALRRAPAEATARVVQAAFAGGTRIIAVEDEGVGWNLDTPEELERISKAGGREIGKKR